MTRSPHRIVVTQEETFHLCFDSETEVHQALALLEQGHEVQQIEGMYYARLISKGHCREWQGFTNNVPINEDTP